MPSPQSGQTCNLVSPAAPQAAQDACDATAGSTDTSSSTQTQRQGQVGSTQAPVHKPDPTKTAWIEIVLVDEVGKPVPGESYAITLPDGQTVATGTLDDKGFARVEGFDPGSCQVTFPELDQDAWKPA
jgi:type VI secretion system secreted protein VgrG